MVEVNCSNTTGERWSPTELTDTIRAPPAARASCSRLVSAQVALERPTVDVAKRLINAVMLDPDDPDGHERDQVGHITRPAGKELASEMSRMFRAGKVEDSRVTALAKTPSISA